MKTNTEISRVNKSKIGSIGESIAARYLENKGFRLVSKNFLKKYGEIDLILEKDGELLFVEVKAVTCEIKNSGGGVISRVPEGLMPEDNVHTEKLIRLGRTIRAYLMGFPESQNWRFDVVAVFIDPALKRAVVRRLENVLIPI